MPNYIRHSWDEFDLDIDVLARMLENDKYDLIVGITRGGLIPAVALSHKLETPMEGLRWSTRHEPFIRDFDHLDKIFNGSKKVLFVEDIIDTGKTFHEIERAADMRNFRNYAFASLWHNCAWELSVKHYYVHTIDRVFDDRWIIFPWERK